MLGIERGGQTRLDLAAIDQGFQFTRCLLMISHHLLGERLGICVRLLRERELAGLDLEHVADGYFIHEVPRLRRRGRLGKCSRRDESEGGSKDKGSVHKGYSDDRARLKPLPS